MRRYIEATDVINVLSLFYNYTDAEKYDLALAISAVPTVDVPDTNVGDMISRQAAIDALERKKDKNAKGDIGGFYNKIIQNDVDALMQLPSAQPERKHGKWIRHSIGHKNVPWGFDCSACGEWFVIGEDTAERYNYCPNCGAEMERRTDE